MSVSSVSVNAASLNLMTVINGIPRLLHGYGALRQALDSVEFTTNPNAASLISRNSAEDPEEDFESPVGLNRRAGPGIPGAAGDLAGTRCAISALRQALPSDSPADDGAVDERETGASETNMASTIRQGGASEKGLQADGEAGRQFRRALWA